MPKKKNAKRGVVVGYGRNWKRSTQEKKNFSDIPKIRGKRGGLYILYSKKKIVYIGKSDDLIRRLGQHTKGALKTKWDSFTWFITKKSYTSDLEALLHHIYHNIKNVKLNKIRARFIIVKKRTLEKE